METYTCECSKLYWKMDRELFDAIREENPDAYDFNGAWIYKDYANQWMVRFGSGCIRCGLVLPQHRYSDKEE